MPVRRRYKDKSGAEIKCENDNALYPLGVVGKVELKDNNNIFYKTEKLNKDQKFNLDFKTLCTEDHF